MLSVKMNGVRRTTLGPHFNEGARLLWAAIAERGWTQGQAEAAIGSHKGLLNRWLYGLRKPGRASSAVLQDKLGIPAPAWDMPPTVEFIPPAVALARAEETARSDAEDEEEDVQSKEPSGSRPISDLLSEDDIKRIKAKTEVA